MQDQNPQPQQPIEPPAPSIDPVPSQIVQNTSEVINPEYSFSWQASEFVHHEKSALWYAGLGVIGILLVVALVLLHQYLGAVVVAVMVIAVAVYSRKQPRTLLYAIDDKGVSIEGKIAPYSDYHSYSVLDEIAWSEIDLEPSKRFAPRLTLLTERESFDQIEAILSQHLPRQDRELDVIERLTRYLKF